MIISELRKIQQQDAKVRYYDLNVPMTFSYSKHEDIVIVDFMFFFNSGRELIILADLLKECSDAPDDTVVMAWSVDDYLYYGLSFSYDESKNEIVLKDN